MENVEFYQIGGLFMQSRYPPIIFGGWFRMDEGQDTFEGGLMDGWGLSKIEGLLREEQLTFDKRYQGREDVIHYSFEKEGDLWVGSYDGSKTLKGGALAKTNKISFSRDDISRQSFTEEHAQNLIHRMVEEGYLETCEGEDGEECLRSTPKGEARIKDYADSGIIEGSPRETFEKGIDDIPF